MSRSVLESRCWIYSSEFPCWWKILLRIVAHGGASAWTAASLAALEDKVSFFKQRCQSTPVESRHSFFSSHFCRSSWDILISLWKESTFRIPNPDTRMEASRVTSPSGRLSWDWICLVLSKSLLPFTWTEWRLQCSHQSVDFTSFRSNADCVGLTYGYSW